MFEGIFGNGVSKDFFSLPIRAFDWRDVLDILLLALLFFAVYRYVRDRRAGRLLMGVGLLAVTYIVSDVLDLYAVRYLFGSFFGYSLLFVAIIFQPELRALLERVGAMSYRRLKNINPELRNRSTLSQKDLDEIVLAVKHMS